MGDDLRALICEKFLGGKLKDRPLNAVADMAANEGSPVDESLSDHFIRQSGGDFSSCLRC